ncbi:MAG TPA: SRPBCC family protein [Actinomycetota bacterium]|nr:SRPBCC family protein [Actinomycetota bacterium]
MEIENEFSVPAPVDHVWAFLLDVERVAPCMPGAELTEVVDDTTWKGKVHMKLGPVSLAFSGTVTMQERDDEARRVVLAAKGMEQKGKGAANASVTSWLEPGDGQGETKVKMKADIHLTGTVAQLSRGLLPEVSRKLTAQFADCLHQSMEAQEVELTASADVAAETPAPAPAKAIGGFRLGLSAIWAGIKRFVARLFGKREG